MKGGEYEGEPPIEPPVPQPQPQRNKGKVMKVFLVLGSIRAEYNQKKKKKVLF